MRKPPTRYVTATAVVAATALAALGGSTALGSPAGAAPSSGVVVNEVYGGGTPGPLRIHDIQGTTWLSPQNGKTVTDVPGIVTGVRGDSVLVSGKVSDFYPLSSGESVSTTSNLSITEIDETASTVVSSGNALPPPIVLTPSTVPDTYAPDLGGGTIESTPITPTRSALDF